MGQSMYPGAEGSGGGGVFGENAALFLAECADRQHAALHGAEVEVLAEAGRDDCPYAKVFPMQRYQS